jgi:uncharacterized protein (TIGR02284 family)
MKMASTDTNPKEVIGVLNDLIETSKDGEEGFKECAENVERSDLKAMFMDRARDCAMAAGELQTIVQRLGGTPEDSASTTGSLHRRWVDLKAALTGKSEQAILNECERGEDVAKKNYQKALDNQALPPDIRAVVERQYQGVLRNHDQVKALRDAGKAR